MMVLWGFFKAGTYLPGQSLIWVPTQGPGGGLGSSLPRTENEVASAERSSVSQAGTGTLPTGGTLLSISPGTTLGRRHGLSGPEFPLL